MTLAPASDISARFVIETHPVHGRLVRLSDTIDGILSAHAYPDEIATLLGEACLLAVMVGSSLKFDGRLILQAQGNGVVQYVVADFDTSGGLRGFCRYDPEGLDALITENAKGFQSLGASDLLGTGTFVMTIDPEGEMERYQGITPIEGVSLSLCAEHYFAQSEQVPTQIRLHVARAPEIGGGGWQASGAMIQAIAGDMSRGDTRESFDHIRALFETLGEDELGDFTLSTETLLYRLFHEDGVRLSPPKTVFKQCRCSQERVENLVRAFSMEERDDMREADGLVHITCEYCSKSFAVDPGKD